MPCNLNDWVVNPSPKECEKVMVRLGARQIIQIVHDFDEAKERCIVEPKPELGLTIREIAQRCQGNGYKLCLDTEHIVRPYRYGKKSPFLRGYKEGCGDSKSPEGLWGYAVDSWAPYVTVLHIRNNTGLHMRSGRGMQQPTCLR